MKKISILLLLVTMAISCSAEQLQGIVINQKGKPLRKVRVYTRASKINITTDENGKFAFDDISPDDTLAVCPDKKHEARFPVANLHDITVKIDKKNFAVNNGQSEKSYEYEKIQAPRRQLNVITRAQVEESNAESLYELLRGRLGGVMVSGDQVIVRGAGSINSKVEPIFVVDGMTYSTSAEADRSVNVRDIEKVEVSKEGFDYGAKGVNGVIIITTVKSAKK